MMKNLKRILPSLAALGVFALAGVASAGTITIANSAFAADTGTGHGGEFIVTAFSGATPDTTGSAMVSNNAGSLFQTFCLEKNENLGGATNFAINTAADLGGTGGGSPDPLSEDTAQLYYAFWYDLWSATATTADDYNYADSGGTRIDDAGDMQLAIWFLEDEISFTKLQQNDNGKAEKFVDFAQTVTWSDLGAGSLTGIGDVRVLNLTKADGTLRQDVLVVVPLPPAALLGLGLLGGLGAAAGVRRRRRRQSA